MFNPQVKAMIDAVRNDSIVGRNTCTSVDEAMTDEELAEYLHDEGCTTPAKAVIVMRHHEEDWSDHQRELRAAAGVFDDGHDAGGYPLDERYLW